VWHTRSDHARGRYQFLDCGQLLHRGERRRRCRWRLRPAELDVFRARGIDIDDLEMVEGERSFFWKGRYEADMNVAHTLDTQLNVFGGFDPVLSANANSASIVFLASIQPELQLRVRSSAEGPTWLA
jgi:hypothetical protein